MGVTCSRQNKIIALETEKNPKLTKMLPLYLMKRNLMEKLNIDDSHFYAAFLNYRFKSSIRKSTEI